MLKNIEDRVFIFKVHIYNKAIVPIKKYHKVLRGVLRMNLELRVKVRFLKFELPHL